MDKIKEIKMELSNIHMKNLLLSEEEINDELTTFKEKLVLSRNNHIKLQKLQEKKSSITTLLNNKKEVIYSIIVLSDKEKEKYNKDLYNATTTIEKLENDLTRINNTMNIKELETQINFIRYSNELNELNAQIEENKKRKLTIIESLDKYSKISKSIEISESKLVYRFIDTLNERVNYHLETMFYDPLTVNITCFKDTKKGEKPHIDFVVYYKGNETDISNLSGGEFDRLNLAFLLSFNELSDSGVIILDEALSSLNQELVADIIEHIQDTNNNNRKLVLMTLHQSIKGMFDQVISL
jgi:DNA repair exonuclease SbcCD ATPase subunit